MRRLIMSVLFRCDRDGRTATTDTVYISLLIQCWTTFCLQYSGNPPWNGLVQAELYIIPLEEHLQSALEMLEVGICSTL
jgi:hypothetical protein